MSKFVITQKGGWINSDAILYVLPCENREDTVIATVRDGKTFQVDGDIWMAFVGGRDDLAMARLWVKYYADETHDTLRGLLRVCIDAGHSREDILVTIKQTPGLWKYCMGHNEQKPERALQFIMDEVNSAWVKSGRALGE